MHAIEHTRRHCTVAERALIINHTHAEARLMYERGRSDRVLGLTPSLKYGANLYYLRAYSTEASKEVALQVAA